jgi:DNA gyrase/topoisomerase IV subunit A
MKMKHVDALALVKDCYTEYARHTNGKRAIPDSRDGLKAVQRRIIATFMLRTSIGEHKCPAIIGRCQEYYHPHGEQAIFDALVNMANDRNKWIIGHGNMGKRTFLGHLKSAAMRYVSAELNEKEVGDARRLIDFAEFYKNEDDYDEPIAIPTCFPYALCNGATGIGVGCATSIPPFNREDLRNAAKDLFRGKTPDLIEPECLGGGFIEIEEEQLIALNQKGKGWGWACAEWEWTHDEASDQKAIRIFDVPDYVNLSKLNVLLRDHINDGAVFVRDDTQRGSKNLEVVVGRSKRIKRISDEEIEKVVSKVCKRRVTWNCVFSRKGIAQTMTPVQVLEDAITYGTQCYKDYISHEIRTLENEILFETIKGELSRLLQNDTPDKKIITTLNLTQDQYRIFTARSLSRLRSAKRETAEMEERCEILGADLLQPKRAYARSIGLGT